MPTTHASPTATRATPARPLLQRKCACGAAAGLVAGRCPDCERKKMLGLQAKLSVSTPGDRFEREADQAAEQVLSGSARPTLTPLAAAPLQREDDKPKPAPTPLGEGLATVGKNLGENNPAFGAFTGKLAEHFLAQPAPISVGVPAFLGANYAFLWGMALIDPAMRRCFDDFNLAMLPGLVPQFPVKTFQYRILDSAQTRFAFDIGLDASKLMTVFNKDKDKPSARVSSLKFDTGGKLDTAASSKPLSLSSMQVQLGLFGDGVLLSGGFRNGVSPYPLMGDDGSRVMAQTPALPDLYANQRDVRFTLQLDLLKLAGHFGAPAPAPREPGRLQRQAADAAPVADGVADAAVRSTLAGAGAPLDTATRGFMEARFGHDFGRVRIHAGSSAAASAQAVQARAYTLGENIVFGPGQYAPSTGAGRRLLAHELAHVVQQQAAPAQPVLMRKADPMQRQFRYDRTQFGDLFDGLVDLDAHRVTLVMRLDVQDQGRPEGKEERVAAFRARAKSIIEQTWSGAYALQSVCHGSPDKLEARVLVVMTSDAPHREIGLWPDQGERSKSTAWQVGDTTTKERESPVLIDPKKPPSEKNLRMATFMQNTVAHEFGHLMGLQHVVCNSDAERCYGVTAEQKMDIMGYGSVVSQRDYAPFLRIMQRHGQDQLPAMCNSWRLVAPG